MEEGGGDGGIDAAAEAEDDAAAADLAANGGDFFFDEVGGGPVAAAAADVVDEVAEDEAALGRVHDFGVELDGVEAAIGMGGGGEGGVGGVGEGQEAGGQPFDFVAVAHPDLAAAASLLFLPIAEEGGGVIVDVEEGGAVFAFLAGGDTAAEIVGEELHAVADAEDGQAALEEVGGQGGRALIVDAVGAAAEDEALGVVAHDELGGRAPGVELTVDAGLAHAAGDELRVLGSVVEDDDGGLGVGHGSRVLGGRAAERPSRLSSGGWVVLGDGDSDRRSCR